MSNIASAPSAKNFLIPKNFDLPSNSYKVTQSLAELDFLSPKVNLSDKKFIENSINSKEKGRNFKKSKAMFMIMKEIESDNSNEATDDSAAEETTQHIISEADLQILVNNGSSKSFRYFH
jgi:hypothetical protein